MNKHLVLGFVVVLVAVISAGCGVPQEDYDALEGELQSAIKEYEGLEAEIESATVEYENLISDLDTAMSEIEIATDEIAALESEGAECLATVDEWTEILNVVRLKMAIASELFSPTFLNEDLDNPERIETVRVLVDGVADATITEKFEAWAAAPTDQELALDLLMYVLESVNEDLG